MKATMHNGRITGAKHNDREFAKEKNFYDDGHIDFGKSHENITGQCYPNMSFEQSERKYYEEHFSEALKEVNEGYIRNRHPERCKTMDDWLNSTRTCPEETILQIGNMTEHCSKNELSRCAAEYMRWLKETTKGHCKVLNFALHMDEATPHLQVRKVWQYEDNGILKIGQDKALKALGYELPFPEKPQSRYNNRKMAFDEVARQKWYDICESHGIEIDREPIAGKKHLHTQEYIAEQLQSECEVLGDMVGVLDVERRELEEEKHTLVKERESLEKTVSELQAEISTLDENKRQIEAYIDKLKGSFHGMVLEFVNRLEIKPLWERFVNSYQAELKERAEERSRRPMGMDAWKQYVERERSASPSAPQRERSKSKNTERDTR